MGGRLHWSYRRKLEALLDSDIPESCRYRRGACVTFRRVIERIAEGGERRVYAAGGLVRDLVTGGDISRADVDVKFDRMGKAELRRVFDELGVSMRVDSNERYTYFFVGCDPDVQLEGHMLLPGAEPDIESPCNSLMVDLADMTLLDPTGVGLSDAREKVWRAPPGMDREKWFGRPGGCRLLWRMLKFRLRGFSVPPDDVRSLYAMFAEAAGRGGVTPKDYRNLINQVPDPAAAVSLMLADASSGAASGEAVGGIVEGLLGSGEVWRPVASRGNLPFHTVCEVLREEEIARRGRRAKGKAQGKAQGKGEGKAQGKGEGKAKGKAGQVKGKAEGKAEGKAKGKAEGKAKGGKAKGGKAKGGQAGG